MPIEGGLAGLLRLIPTDDEYRVFVALNDYARAREANGIAAPGQNADDEALDRYLEADFWRKKP